MSNIYNKQSKTTCYDHMNKTPDLKISTEFVNIELTPDVVALAAVQANYGALRLVAALARALTDAAIQRNGVGAISPLAKALEIAIENPNNFS